jgi:formate dehydrogenase iron-sulfur subunit
MSDQTTHSARLSRRRFLSLCAPALGGLALLTANHPSAHARSETDPAAVPAMLIDISRCQGCGNCQRSCDAANGLPCTGDQARLDAQTYTIVDERQPAPGTTRFVKRACMQCLEPGCVAACPVAALHRTEEGTVLADTSKCIGCRYCQYACPFSVPKFEWGNSLGVMRKCTGCTDRIAAGHVPACAAGCPTGALKAGVRGDLLQEAHARISARPGQYVKKVYGEFEAGGTSRLYLSDVPFEELGLPTVDTAPVPRYSEGIVTRTPTIALSVAAVSTATYALLRRRERGLDDETIKVEEE